MSLRLWAAACAAAAIAAPTARAAAAVEVRWLQPETYADAGRGALDREHAMRILGEHLQQLGRQLPDGQSLRIEVLDVDLAGEIEPLGWNQWRVLRGRADWPRLRLRYALQADGRPLREGEARLATLDYLDGRHLGELAYEKRLLDRWFQETFATPPGR